MTVRSREEGKRTEGRLRRYENMGVPGKKKSHVYGERGL